METYISNKVVGISLHYHYKCSTITFEGWTLSTGNKLYQLEEKERIMCLVTAITMGYVIFLVVLTIGVTLFNVITDYRKGN